MPIVPDVLTGIPRSRRGFLGGVLLAGNRPAEESQLRFSRLSAGRLGSAPIRPPAQPVAKRPAEGFPGFPTPAPHPVRAANPGGPPGRDGLRCGAAVGGQRVAIRISASMDEVPSGTSPRGGNPASCSVFQPESVLAARTCSTPLRSHSRSTPCCHHRSWQTSEPRRSGPASYMCFLFTFASALFKSSFTLSFTIRLIKSKGMGLSSGNLTELFPVL